jgi:hypothetical protein
MRCIDAVPSRGPTLRRSPGLPVLCHSATLLDPSAAVRLHCAFIHHNARTSDTHPLLHAVAPVAWLASGVLSYYAMPIACCPLFADDLHSLCSLRCMASSCHGYSLATRVAALCRAKSLCDSTRFHGVPPQNSHRANGPVQRIFAHCSGASLCRVPSPCRTTLARMRSAIRLPHCAACPLRYVPRRCSAEAYIIPPSSTLRVHRSRLRWISSQSSPRHSDWQFYIAWRRAATL